MLPVAVIINNYFHDLATGFLVSSAVILAVLVSRARRSGGQAELLGLAGAYRPLTRFAQFSLAWIVLGGIPRVIFFTRYEWDPAVANGIVAALAVKHAMMFLAVAVGSLWWIRIGKDLKQTDGQAS